MAQKKKASTTLEQIAQAATKAEQTHTAAPAKAPTKAPAAPAAPAKGVKSQGKQVTAFGWYPIKQSTTRQMGVSAAPLPNGDVIIHLDRQWQIASGLKIMANETETVYTLE